MTSISEIVAVIAPGIALSARRGSNTPSTKPRSATGPRRNGMSSSALDLTSPSAVTRRSRASCRAGFAGARRRRHRRCDRRHGRPNRCRAPSRCCNAPRARRAGASAPSGQYASSPPSQSWNHAMPVAIGMRYSSNNRSGASRRAATAGRACGSRRGTRARRCAPRVLGPGTIRFAYAIAGSITGRPWIARAASTNAS